MTPGPTLDDLYAVVAAASIGDATARVAVPEDATDPVSRLAIALNVLLDDLAFRAAEATAHQASLQLVQEQNRRLEAKAAEAFRKSQEEKLRGVDEARLRLSAIVESSADAIIGKSLDGTITSWNRGAERVFGYTAAEMIGRSVTLLIPPGREHEERTILEHLRKGEPLDQFETVRRRKDGRDINVSVTLSPIRSAAGEVIGASKIARDITDRVRLDEAREKLSVFVAASGDAIIGRSRDGLITSWNPGAERIFGYKAAEILGKPIELLIPPGSGHVRPNVEEHLESGRPFETVTRTKDGRDINVSSTVARVGSGEIISITRDISERVRLDEARAKLDALVKASGDAIFGRARDGRITSWNPGAERIFGYRAEEIVGKSVELLLPPGRVAPVPFQETAAAVETVNRTKDGRDLDLSSTLTLVAPDELIVVCRDITERKKLEGALRQAEKRMRTEAEDALLRSLTRYNRLSEAGLAGIIVGDASGKLLEANDAYLNMLGYSREEFQTAGLNWAALTPPEWKQGDARALEQLAATGVAAPREKELFRKDGSRAAILLGVAMLEDSEFIALVADLSGRKRMEKELAQSQEQFRQAQKMEAVGRLAGGVAHDFNNLLSVILTYSEMAIRSLPAGEPLRADLVEIKKAGDRATALTRQLLAFSRQQVLEPRVVNLNDLIVDAGKMLARLIGEDIELVVQPGQALGSVLADPGQIEQVLMNLAVNARDAMPRGGKLTLETANVDLGEAYMKEHFGVTPGPYVMLAVSDTGTGMDKATQARIFEPFFTTKEKGKGTGLGLATVFGIVQQSHGHIWVYSEPGKGTSFKAYLPRTDAAPMQAESAADELTTLSGTETILLVEDEDQIRAVVLTLLRSFGYHVLEARNGGEALLIAEKHPGKIDLLLTDVVMPLMSGAELAQRLGAVRTDMKVLCMSGYTDEAVLSHGILEAGLAFLQKPITPDKLGRKIREVLAAR
jgi:PAS domain S-box-containing protein